jgi:hypothetical protein
LVALVFYLIQIPLMIFGGPYPADSEGWFELFQRSRMLGLLYLNALDILSVTLLGVMFLALYVALRQVHPSRMAIATYLALLGVAVFIVPRVAMLSVLPLSDLYVDATTEAQRSQLLAAWTTLNALGTATPQTPGFLLMAIAGGLISTVTLQGQAFPRAVGYLGIVAALVTLANQLSMIVLPAAAAILMPVNGLLWLIWWLAISRGLFRLASIGN